MENNIFSNPPASLTSDEALAALRKKLSPTEGYYCGFCLQGLVDEVVTKNFSVGSMKRYSLRKLCNICADEAAFVVTELFNE